jgi:Ca2+/Na+ antiporter
MRKPKIGRYIRLLGLILFLAACDILLLFPIPGNMLPAAIILIVLLAVTGVISFKLVREIRRPDENVQETEDDITSQLRRGIGWGVFHLIWLTVGLGIMLWLKIVMHLPDPSIAEVTIPFAVFAGIVGIAIIVTVIRIVLNVGRMKKNASGKHKKE